MSFPSVIHWLKKLKCGLFWTEDAPHTRRPKIATSVKMVAKVKEDGNTDTR
jgi:hypothetical protein